MRNFIDWLYRLFAPKLGASWEDDENDYTYDKVKASQMLGAKAKDFSKHLMIKNQGRTNRCTAYAMSSVLEGMLQSYALKKKLLWSRVYIDEESLWDKQIIRAAHENRRLYGEQKRIMERGGDYIHNALGAVIDNGVMFEVNEGGVVKKYRATFEGYARADKEGTRKLKPLEMAKKVQEINDKGHPIFTGARLGTPWYKDGQWNVVKRAIGGHAFAQSDYEDFNYYGPNSWGSRWADSGYWKLHGSKGPNCFGFYFLYGMEVKEV